MIERYKLFFVRKIDTKESEKHIPKTAGVVLRKLEIVNTIGISKVSTNLRFEGTEIAPPIKMGIKLLSKIAIKKKAIPNCPLFITNIPFLKKEYDLIINIRLVSIIAKKRKIETPLSFPKFTTTVAVNPEKNIAK